MIQMYTQPMSVLDYGVQDVFFFLGGGEPYWMWTVVKWNDGRCKIQEAFLLPCIPFDMYHKKNKKEIGIYDAEDEKTKWISHINEGMYSCKD